MDGRTWRQLVVGTIAGAVLTSPLMAAPLQRGPGGGVERGWPGGANHGGYDRGYREGLQQGERDARSGRPLDFQRASAYRSGDHGYNRQLGDREGYRVGFREGFADGYRTGFDRHRRVAYGPQTRRNDNRVLTQRVPRGYQEQAHARGYSDGFARGLDDGRDRDRYDPVGHRDYREADQGYSGSYGSKDAYKNNYRAGFRQGYEDGYRDGQRRRR